MDKTYSNKTLMKKLLIIGIFLSFGFTPPISSQKSKPGKGIILLKVNGYKPFTPLFNLYDYLSPSTLSSEEVLSVEEKVTNYFSNFDVTITTNDSLFYTFPIDHRIKVIITNNKLPISKSGVLHYSGGLSNYNALYNGDTSASVVTSGDLSNNTRYIADAIAHECGHQLGLWHQSKWFLFFKIKEYNHGNSQEAPLMGTSYDAKKAIWTKGFNTRYQWQDDKKIIGKTWTILHK